MSPRRRARPSIVPPKTPTMMPRIPPKMPSKMPPKMLAMMPLVLTLATVAQPAVGLAAEPVARRARLPEGYSEIDGIVAVVGKRIITRTALVRALGQQGRSQQMVPTAATRPRSDRAMLRQVLDALVENELVLSAARELGLTVSDDEVDREIERLKTKNLWDLSELRENVRKLGFAGIREYREHIRTEKLRIKMLRTKLGSRLRITEQEVKRVIEIDYKGGKQAEQARGRHILIKVPPGATPMQVNALRNKAWRIWDLVHKGDRSFAELAEDYSDDVGTAYGGDLGYMFRWMLDPTFARTLWGLKNNGDVSEVIQTPFGFHIVQLVGRRRAPVDNPKLLEQVVRSRLTEEQFIKLYKTWIAELKASQHIEIRL